MFYFLQSNGLADRARDSKRRSQDLKDQADNTKDIVTNGKLKVTLFCHHE